MSLTNIVVSYEGERMSSTFDTEYVTLLNANRFKTVPFRITDKKSEVIRPNSGLQVIAEFTLGIIHPKENIAVNKPSPSLLGVLYTWEVVEADSNKQVNMRIYTRDFKTTLSFSQYLMNFMNHGPTEQFYFA